MADKNTKVQVSSYIEPKLKQKLEVAAKKEKRSVSKIMEMILEKFFQDGDSLL